LEKYEAYVKGEAKVHRFRILTEKGNERWLTTKKEGGEGRVEMPGWWTSWLRPTTGEWDTLEAARRFEPMVGRETGKILS
jgi:hypothetical protein